MCIDKLQVVYHSLIFDYLSFSPSLVHPSYTHFKNIIEPISIFLLTKCRITGWVWDRDDERQKGQVDPAADGLDGEAEAESGRSSGLIFSPFFNLLLNVASQRMMGEMETTRVEEQENYWLIQYQKLLDSKPKGLEEAEGKMDAKVKLWSQRWQQQLLFFQVKQLLVDCGAEELVPVFAKKKVKNAISAIGVALQKALASLQKILFNCRSIFCLQVTFKEVAFLSEVDLKQVSLSFQLAHNLDQPCPDGDLKRVPEKTSSLRDRWSCSTRGLGEDQLRGRCR